MVRRMRSEKRMAETSVSTPPTVPTADLDGAGNGSSLTACWFMMQSKMKYVNLSYFTQSHMDSASSHHGWNVSSVNETAARQRSTISTYSSCHAAGSWQSSTPAVSLSAPHPRSVRTRQLGLPRNLSRPHTCSTKNSTTKRFRRNFHNHRLCQRAAFTIRQEGFKIINDAFATDRIPHWGRRQGHRGQPPVARRLHGSHPTRHLPHHLPRHEQEPPAAVRCLEEGRSPDVC